MSGTVNVARSLWDDPAFRDQPFTDREAWLWMIAEASWKERERRIDRFMVKTQRGQFAASIRFLAERWQWSKSAVSRFLERLENRDMVRKESGTGILVLTICNYDKYQNGAGDGGTVAGHSPGQKRDSSGTNEKKEERRGKEGEEGNASQGALLSEEETPKVDPVEEALTRFYAVFPKRKDGKYSTPAAIRPHLKVAMKKIKVDDLIRCAEVYAASPDHKNCEYALKAEKWLKQEEWQKHLPAPAGEPRKSEVIERAKRQEEEARQRHQEWLLEQAEKKRRREMAHPDLDLALKEMGFDTK